MKSVKKLITCLLVCLGIINFSFLCSCGNSGLSKKEAKIILEKQLGKCYGLAVPKNIASFSSLNTQYRHVRLAKDLELVETTETGSSLTSAQNVTLTEKGNSSLYFEDTFENTSFLVAENKINEIIEVQNDGNSDKQFIVTFSYTQRYNDLGTSIALAVKDFDISWLEDNSKLRGRALLAYDSFLKRYVIQNMMWSEWEKENWKPAMFITNTKEENVLYYSYERSEQIATPVTPIPQERLGRFDRYNTDRESRIREIERRNETLKQERQKEFERYSRDIERAKIKQDLRRLELEAEIERRNAEQALRLQERQKEMERRNAERDLNRKLLR